MRSGSVSWAVARSAIYLYFACGAALLINGLLFSIWMDYGGSDKTFPAIFVIVAFVVIFAVLMARAREDFGRPLSLRKWTLLCLVASAGIAPLVLLLGARPG
jgi:hypothetical protein